MSILAATCNLLLVAEVSLKTCLWVVATVAMVYLITMERTNLIRFPGRFVMKIAKSLGKTVLLGQYVFLTLIITIILKTCAIEPITLYALHLSCRYASCTTLLLLFSNVRFGIDYKKDGKINESQESNDEIQVDKHENLNEDSGFQCEHISKLQSAGTIENNADDPQKTKAEENKKDTNEFQIEKINESQESNNEIQVDKHENLNEDSGFQCEHISKLQSMGMIENNTDDPQKTKAEENKKDTNEFQIEKINESQESNDEIQVDKHENLNEDSGFQCEHISKLQSAGTIENNADDPQKTKAEEKKKDTNEFQIEKINESQESNNEIQVDKHENLNEDSGFQCEHISKLQSMGMIENNTDDPQKTKAEENKKDTNEFQIEKINESQESNDEIQVDKHENLNEDLGFQCEHISKLQSAGAIENNADDPQKTEAEENKKDTNEFQIEKINESQESNDEIQVDKHENLNEDSGFQCEHISKLQSMGMIENNTDDPQKTKAEENKKDTNEFQIEKINGSQESNDEIQVDKHENLNEDSGFQCEHISKLQSAGTIENNADDPQKTKAEENKKDTNEFQIEKINESQESNNEIQVDKHENLNEDSGFQCEHISKLQSMGMIENNADDPQKTKAEENKRTQMNFKSRKSMKAKKAMTRSKLTNMKI